MKYFCIRQMDETDCAAACLSTICKQYGVNKNVTKIREMAGTDKNGTNGIGVIKAATELGYKAYGIEDSVNILLLYTGRNSMYTLFSVCI
ncbi:cysteine peptidase family C39 domain-containing protein [[Clostridium] polysaccharolyticum]|uniref:cysteine peptidase family C39 domain-containing protein n=1 Tax=[Clostridium] polysaccharolyticum TaxID=29364 RepID=UPI000B80F4BD|nr:cysteine peptidase family C39 domain-containing protein [[Clostridium] polysaccharolyticum]